MPGDVGFSFNNEAFPGSAQAWSQFAIPSYAGQPDTGTAVRWQTGAHFVTGMPLAEQIARQVSATDPTSQAIHYQRLEAEARKQFRPKPLPRRRW
jgi:hypothetical protein